MENRWHRRFAACIHVAIQFPGGKTLRGLTRNVSSGGMFVDIDRPDLPAHALVQILLPAGDEATADVLRVPAVMTYRTREGIGLAYFGSQDRLRKSISAWLRALRKGGNSDSQGTAAVTPSAMDEYLTG